MSTQRRRAQSASPFSHEFSACWHTLTQPSLTNPFVSFPQVPGPGREKGGGTHLGEEGRRLSPHPYSLGESSRLPATIFLLKGWGTEPPPGSCLHKDCHLLPCSWGPVLSGSWADTQTLGNAGRASPQQRGRDIEKEEKIQKFTAYGHHSF